MKKRIDKQTLRLSLLQSTAAAVFILAAFFCVFLLDQTLLLTSLGASAFIAFAFPNAESARTRYLIGGYGCAVLTGAVFWGILQLLGSKSFGGSIFCCVGAVFCVIFLMTVFDFEHPPAVAAAITIVLTDKPFGLAAVAVTGVLVLCGCKTLFIKMVEKAGLTEEMGKALTKK